ncbi:amino acid ABC transporter substrate-binding protein [Georgenia sp. SYP-B2076]|uniref:amino acid ABC transporter substrate-binding protein n=1 Tax=Georgenia sp. SYP-B2076 TaxID=2495881 RepID=UPI000F8C7189|nr:amino acid ABC transporter substrate-binding protein [Georgenia sp. SYP-B2076]
MKRARYAVALAAALTATLAACSSGGSGGGSTGAASSQADSALAQVQESGVLRVGTEGTYAPFTFHDASTNDLTGYDVDVITAVADKLGVKPEFSETQWDAIFPGLEAGRYDVIANQVSITEERQAKYDMSEPYTVSTGVVITRADDNEITSMADVKGRTAAQTATSNWNKIATDAGAKVEPVEGFTQTVALLKQGRIDLTFNDNLAVLDYLKSTGDKDVKIAFETDESTSQALAMRKDSGLLDAVNGALGDLRADGTLTEISQKWFGEDVSQ